MKNRRLADEDDELSEVQPDAVPPEVREWLASTFTRQLATTKRKTDEKPKFRSVAHAIRAGIFVDRIYRRVSSSALMQFPPEVVKALKVRAKPIITIKYCQIVKLKIINFQVILKNDKLLDYKNFICLEIEIFSYDQITVRQSMIGHSMYSLWRMQPMDNQSNI